MKTYKQKIIGIMVLFLLGSVYRSNAQSIVGKWERASIKRILTDKATGERKDMSAQGEQVAKMIRQVIEFKADNTWVSTTTFGSGKGASIDGTYTFSGNHLTMKLNPKLEKDFKEAGDQLKKSKYARPDGGNYMPPEVNLQSLTNSTMVWHLSSETRTGQGGSGKQYTVESETTYKKI